jgi:sugar lactone lactonase YvrE
VTDVWSAERILASAAVVGEGPVWDSDDRCLYWVDIERGEVHRFDPVTRRDTVVIALDRHVGAVGLRETGGLVLAVCEGFATWEPGQPDVTVVARPLDSNNLCRMNDGACDPAGRFWGGSMSLQEGVLGQGSLYRLDPDGSVVEVVAGVSLSNGIDWSPDGRTMYHVDTSACTLSAYAFSGLTGVLGPPRILIDFEGGDGYPDGIAVDAVGCIWVAFWLGSASVAICPTESCSASSRSRHHLSRVVRSGGQHSMTSTSRLQHAISVRLRLEQAICSSLAQACRGGSQTDSEGDPFFTRPARRVRSGRRARLLVRGRGRRASGRRA